MKKYLMFTGRALLGIFAALAFVLIITPGTAHAQQQICGNGGTGYCLNEWNGKTNIGAAIKMYYGGNSNENYYVHFLTNMCNGGYATSTCPINAPGVNVAGRPIVSIEFSGNNFGCVATNGSGQAVMGVCPDDSGNGGSNGTIMVWQITGISTGACPFQGNGTFSGYLVDRYWSNTDQQQEDLFSGGNPGVQAFFGGGNGTCWGGL